MDTEQCQGSRRLTCLSKEGIEMPTVNPGVCVSTLHKSNMTSVQKICGAHSNVKSRLQIAALFLW